MSFKGDLSTIGLAEVFQMISMSQKEGTLVVQDNESRKAIYFGADGVQLHSAGKRKGFRIGDILVRAGKISVGQLREVLEQQQGTRRMLGQELIQRGLVTEQEISDVVKSQIEEEIYDLFLWRKANFEFIEGPPIEELQDPETRAIRLAFDVNSLLLEAVRRTDEWTLINQKIPSMDCIYTFVSNSAREEEDASATDQTRSVYQYLDGQATVADVMEQSFVPRFEVCKILIDLLDRGRVRLLTPTELVGVARRRLEEGRRDKGLKLFAVAAQLAPEDPDCIGKYAHALETEGMIQDAARMYVRVGHLLKQQGQEKDALAYFQRAVSLNPDDMQSKIALFEINLATASVEEAMATASELITNCIREKDFDTAREIAEQAVAAAPQSLEMRLALAKVYHALGLKKERDDVVLFLRKNLPVDQAAADKIIADLRELSDRSAEPAATRPPPVISRRRRGMGISVGRLAAVLLLVVLLGAVVGAVVFEFYGRAELDRLVREAREFEGAKKWDEARDRIASFGQGTYHLSPLAMGKMRDALNALAQRKADAERAAIKDPTPLVDPEGPRKEREKALAKIREDLRELNRLKDDGRYDAALKLAEQLRAECAKWNPPEDVTKRVNAIYDELAPKDFDVRSLKQEADRLTKLGKYKDAAGIIVDLHNAYPFWETAQNAAVPFAIIARPAGVKVYKKRGNQPWDSDPFAESKDEPIVQHLAYPLGKFTLRFEKTGFKPVEQQVTDDRQGVVEVRLSERLALETRSIGVALRADPVIADDLMYVLAQGRVRVVTMSGRVVCDEAAETAPRAGPGGIVCFGSGDRVVAIDGRKGADARLWEYEAGERVTAPIGFSSKGDAFYFTTKTDVCAVDMASRKQLWTHPTPAPVVGASVEFNGLVLVACENGTVCAFSADGRAWQKSTGGTLKSGPALGVGGGVAGMVCVGSSDGRVYGFDAKSGEEKWTSEKMPSALEQTPSLDGDLLWAASNDGTIVCLDAKGAEQWRRKPGKAVRARVVPANGLLLVGDTGGVLHALDLITGEPEWTCTTNGAIRTAPAVAGTRAYAPSDDKSIYVVPLD